MDKQLKLDYFERLISDNHSESYFIEQFLKGSGNELKEKFWSSRSSSRLCFDLYSWLCNEPKVNNFQFEKQLPGVKTGKNRVSGVPNMDVYFEYENDIIFIELPEFNRSVLEVMRQRPHPPHYGSHRLPQPRLPHLPG